jgi:hypothetical protein
MRELLLLRRRRADFHPREIGSRVNVVLPLTETALIQDSSFNAVDPRDERQWSRSSGRNQLFPAAWIDRAWLTMGDRFRNLNAELPFLSGAGTALLVLCLPIYPNLTENKQQNIIQIIRG